MLSIMFMLSINPKVDKKDSLRQLPLTFIFKVLWSVLSSNSEKQKRSFFVGKKTLQFIDPSAMSASCSSGSQQGLAGSEAHCLSPRGGRRGGFGGQSLWYCALSWGVGRSGGGRRGCTALIWNSLSLGGGGQTRNSNRNKQEIQFSLKTSISTGSSYYELFNYIFLGIWQKQTYGQRKPNILTQPPPTLAAATWEKVIWPPAENWGGRDLE